MPFESASLAGISIDRLQTFCAVVEAGTIVLTPPDRTSATGKASSSRQLTQLEKALGTCLFDRAGKTLQLNQNGRRVALAAHTFFGALDDVMNTGRERTERVRLGAGEAVLRWLVMPHIRELMSGDPPLRFDVHSLSTESALREIRTGSLDLAILRTDSVTGEDLQSQVITTLKYVLAIPRTLLSSREGYEELLKGGGSCHLRSWRATECSRKQSKLPRWRWG